MGGRVLFLLRNFDLLPDFEIPEIQIFIEFHNFLMVHLQFSGKRAEVLVLKLERLDELWPVIGSFVGRDVAAKRSNIRSQSRDGETYQGVQAALSLPRDHVERLYDHPWMRHFYADQEVAAFIEQWSGLPDLSCESDTNDSIS